MKIRRRKEEKKKIFEDQEIFRKITNNKIDNHIKYLEMLMEDKEKEFINHD